MQTSGLNYNTSYRLIMALNFASITFMHICICINVMVLDKKKTVQLCGNLLASHCHKPHNMYICEKLDMIFAGWFGLTTLTNFQLTQILIVAYTNGFTINLFQVGSFGRGWLSQYRPTRTAKQFIEFRCDAMQQPSWVRYDKILVYIVTYHQMRVQSSTCSVYFMFLS